MTDLAEIVVVVVKIVIVSSETLVIRMIVLINNHHHLNNISLENIMVEIVFVNANVIEHVVTVQSLNNQTSMPTTPMTTTTAVAMATSTNVVVDIAMNLNANRRRQLITIPIVHANIKNLWFFKMILCFLFVSC